MRFELVLFLGALVLCVQGQTTLVPNYFCDENNDSVEFTLSPLFHSAWEPTANCSLDECLLSSHNNNSCRSSTTPCFDYRTPNNSRYCAPGILCSILEPCNSTTYTCASDDLVCVINSCCSPQAVCIPAAWTSFCALATTATATTNSMASTTTTSSSSSSTTTTMTSSSTSTSSTTTTTSTSPSSTSSTSSTGTTTTTATTVATTAVNCNGPKPASLGTVSGNTNTSWVSYTYNYTASKTSPLLIFGFDASSSMYIALDDISVVDIAYSSIQLLSNPSFENSTTIPTGWTVWCSSSCNSGTAGAVANSSCRTDRCYISQCAGGGVDYLEQAFSATIGHTYSISFWSQRVKFASTSNSAITLYIAII